MTRCVNAGVRRIPLKFKGSLGWRPQRSASARASVAGLGTAAGWVSADDHIAENAVLMLDKVRLGEVVISNSTVIVKKDTGQYLVIGKEMLDKAGTYQVDVEKSQLIFK